jgi:hypothetical protein
MMNGSKDAAVILVTALTAAKGPARERLLAEILKLREQRAAPLYAHLVRHLDRNKFPQLYLASIEALGAFGGSDAIEALKAALHTGHWWTLFANRKFGGAAAHALRRIGTAGAMDTLRQASTTGAPGARGAAKAELTGAA